MALDFLMVLDQAVRENNLGYIQDGATLKKLALDAALVTDQDQWSAARWTGELIDLGYLSHSKPGLGDRLPLPKGGYADSDLYRFHEYRLTASGYEAAGRERARRAETENADHGIERVATLKVSKTEAEGLLRKQIEAGGVLVDEAGGLSSEHTYSEWKMARTRWLRFTEEVVRAVFVDASLADGIETKAPRAYVAGIPWHQNAQLARDRFRRELNQVVSLRERLQLATEPYIRLTAQLQEVGVPADIFIVHGRNTGVREEVARFVQRITGSDPVILHEQANQGRTLIEKFEGHAQTSGYVIVLSTGDDKGGPINEDHKTFRPRARQNVVFEMGFFFGSLGRNRVAVLYEQDIEPPSDIAGLVYIPLAGNWKLDLYRELKAAGIDADISRAT